MKDSVDTRKKAGFIIMLVAVAELSLVFTFGGIWFNSNDFYVDNNQINGIEGAGLNSQINTSVDVDSIFANTYYKALDVLSEGIAFGTAWLDICPNSQIQIGEEIYIKVCSDKYPTKSSLVASANKYISKQYIEELMANNFIDHEGDLYIKPISVSKNEEYIEFVSYKLVKKTNDKITYSVKSKYGPLGCINNCNYKYKEHVFELVREGSKWLVSNFEMPY